MDLKEMLETTKKSIKKNNTITEQKIKQETEDKETRASKKYDINSRETKMILSLGLNIDKFEPQNPEDDHYNAEEYYYCSNDIWKVNIRNLLYDADLGTILQVLKLTDKFTEREVDFYCDLWCQNTGENKLKQLKYLLEHTYDEYIEYESGKYFNLPKLLREKGFKVIEHDFTFDINKCNGYLEISNPNILKNKNIFNNKQPKSYLKINYDYGIDITLNSILEDSCFNENICYSINYNNEKDIDTISDTINKHLEHIKGDFGYLENGIYYTNEDIENIFNKYSNKFDYLADITDEYQHDIGEEQTDEEIDVYNRMCDLAEINHYKGAEIYKKYELILNDNGMDNKYEFEIIYNLNINKKDCIFNIKYINEKVYIFSEKGSFAQLKDILIQFLEELSEIVKED